MKRRAVACRSTSSNQSDVDMNVKYLLGLGHTDGCIPGMESVIATTSGYKRQEKIKLIELITETGARCTGSLTKYNTHLVCREFRGHRYAVAKRLRLTVINHKWFEDCLRARKKLPESPYIMCCGREIGPLLWEPPVVAEARRHKESPLSHGQTTMISNSSASIVIRKSPLQMQENYSKHRKIAEASSYKNAHENKRPSLTRRDKQVQHEMPLQDVTNKLYSRNADIEVTKCSNSKQNVEKQRKKGCRLVKKSDCVKIYNYYTRYEDDIEEPSGTSNVDEHKDTSQSKNSETVPKAGQGVSSSDAGIEFIRCTSLENRKQSNEEQPCESAVEMDIDIEKDTGMCLTPSLPAPSPASEISCPICLTVFSSCRGVLLCGHRFCFKCIRKWAAEMVSKKKEPTCPLCQKNFEFITIKNHANSNDQKIFSQSLPEFTDDNIFMVQNDLAANLQLTTNLQCNICGSGDTEELLLKCHRCGRRAAHVFCLDPPLPPVPDVPWTCAPCTSGRRPVYEFAHI